MSNHLKHQMEKNSIKEIVKPRSFSITYWSKKIAAGETDPSNEISAGVQLFRERNFLKNFYGREQKNFDLSREGRN